MNTKFIQQNPLTFDIAELAKKPQGTSDEYAVNAEIELDDPDITPKGNLKGIVAIMKTDNEFNVQLKDIVIDLEFECAKCLNKFSQNLLIPFAEKQYIIKREKTENRDEIGYVETKNQTINIEEFLREEIILHFPLIPVCSTHCNGINLENNA